MEQYQPPSDTLCTSIQATFKPGKSTPVDISIEEIAIRLGKYAGITPDHALWVETYATCALSKALHSDAAQLKMCCQEMAMVKDHLTHKWTRLEKSQQLNKELSTFTPTGQFQASMTTMLSMHLVPPVLGGNTPNTWPPLAPYTDPDIHMLDANVSIINDLYK